EAKVNPATELEIKLRTEPGCRSDYREFFRLVTLTTVTTVLRRRNKFTGTKLQCSIPCCRLVLVSGSLPCTTGLYLMRCKIAIGRKVDDSGEGPRQAQTTLQFVKA